MVIRVAQHMAMSMPSVRQGESDNFQAFFEFCANTVPASLAEMYESAPLEVSMRAFDSCGYARLRRAPAWHLGGWSTPEACVPTGKKRQPFCWTMSRTVA